VPDEEHLLRFGEVVAQSVLGDHEGLVDATCEPASAIVVSAVGHEPAHRAVSDGPVRDHPRQRRVVGAHLGAPAR